MKFTSNQSYHTISSYIYLGNHNNFNTLWEDRVSTYSSTQADIKMPLVFMCELKSVMGDSLQREITKLYVTSFLDGTLKGNTTALNLFRDSRLGDKFLSQQAIVVNQYKNTNTVPIQDFESVSPVYTATGFSSAKVANMTFRVKDWPQLNNALRVSMSRNTAGVVTVTVPSSVATSSLANKVLSSTVLSLDMALETSAANTMTITVSCGSETATYTMSDYYNVIPPLTTRIFKFDGINDQIFNTAFETMLQTYEIPLHKNTCLWSAVTDIKFNFGATSRFSGWLDNVAIRQ